MVAAILSTIEIWQLRRIRTRSTGQGRGSGRGILAEVGASLREALRFLGVSRHARLMIALITVHCLFTMGFDALLPIHARDVFDGDANVFGSLLIAIGVGALLGIVAMTRVTSDRARGALFLATGVGSGWGW